MFDNSDPTLHYLESLNPELPEWMKEIREFGIRNQIPIVRDDLGQFIRLLCNLHKPARILELGSGSCYSTHWFLLGNPDAVITAVDANHHRVEFCEMFIEKTGFKPQVTPVHQRAQDFLETNTETFDLIFLDAMKKEYKDLLDDCVKALNPGGVFLVDNILFGGKVINLLPEQEKKYQNGVNALKAFNQAASVHPDIECTFLPLSDGTLIAQKKKEI